MLEIECTFSCASLRPLATSRGRVFGGFAQEDGFPSPS